MTTMTILPQNITIQIDSNYNEVLSRLAARSTNAGICFLTKNGRVLIPATIMNNSVISVEPSKEYSQ